MNQAHLEAEMRELGASRTRKRNYQARVMGADHHTHGGQRMLQELSPLVAQEIRSWLEHAKTRPGRSHRAVACAEVMDPRLMASLTLKVLIDSLAVSRPYTGTAMLLANLIQDCWIANRFRDECKYEYDQWRRRMKGKPYSIRKRAMKAFMREYHDTTAKWDPADRCALGTVLIEVAIKATGICEVNHRRKGKKIDLVLEPSLQALEWLEGQNSLAEELNPLYLPFVEPPLDWVDPLSGGFHGETVYASALVKTPHRQVLDLLARAVMPDVYDSLNWIQGVPWAINPMVYEVFAHYWQNGLPAVGVPRRDEEPVPGPIESDDPKAKSDHRRRIRMVHDANLRLRGERITAARLYWVSSKYLGIPKFWFMQQLDWRGRAYPVSYYLHPQGDDLTRSLLQFAEGKPVKTPSAISWHSVAGANLWGLDKKPFEARLQWVSENHAMFTRIAEDPIGCQEWMSASDPWQFLAWCLDWYALQSDPDHLSHLPIHQDATQSGLQIYAMLLRDDAGATATNCTPSDAPKDLYQIVADRVTARLAEEASQGSQESLRWLEFGITRHAVKRPVMTRVYNATRHSCRAYIEEWVTEQGRLGKVIPIIKGESTVWYLAERVWDATSEVLQSTARGQEWLTAVARVFADHGLPIVWTTPLGMPCRQWYPDWESYTVKTSFGETYRQISLRKDLDKVDSRRSVQAFAPNLIHSLDATAMFRTMCIARSRGVTSVAAIHDSYATHAADSQTLAEATRQAYVEVFGPDVLARLRDELFAQLPPGAELPPLPEYGSFDVESVRQSRYFFN